MHTAHGGLSEMLRKAQENDRGWTRRDEYGVWRHPSPMQLGGEAWMGLDRQSANWLSADQLRCLSHFMQLVAPWHPLAQSTRLRHGLRIDNDTPMISARYGRLQRPSLQL